MAAFSHSEGKNPERARFQDVCKDVPDDIWELIISKLACNEDDDSRFHPLSLVCKRFLCITNRLKRTLHIPCFPICQFLSKLFLRFPNLTRFSLPVDRIVQLPAGTYSSVRSLILEEYNYIRYGEFFKDYCIIADLFPNLKELDISKAGSINIDLLAPRLHYLKKINLGYNLKLSDKSLLSLTENCPDLEEIMLKGCHKVTSVGVNLALRCCKNLKSIGLFGSQTISSEVTNALSNAKNLREIFLSSMTMSDQFLCALSMADLPLKSFSLSNCSNFTSNELIQFLKAYPFLDYLALEGVNWLKDNIMTKLSSCLRNTKTVKLEGFGISDSTFFVLIKNCPSLDTLEIHNTLIGWKMYDTRNRVKSRLRVLDISHNTLMSNHSLRKIAYSCPNLEVLKLNYCREVSGTGIGYIFSYCPQLRHIQINGCERVSRLGKQCQHKSLEVLEMAHTNIGNETLISIVPRFPELRCLDLTGCKRLSTKEINEMLNKFLPLNQRGALFRKRCKFLLTAYCLRA